MSKVLLFALSCNQERLNHDLLSDSFLPNIHLGAYGNNYYELLVITQGFDQKSDNPYLRIVRDDSVYKKGYKIGEIRQYLTDKYVDSSCDYLLLMDDDMRAKSNFMKMLDSHVELMNSNPLIGLLNFKYGKEFISLESIDNPSKISMWSGMLIRYKSYKDSNQYRPYVSYHEEMILAMNIYLAGYDMKISNLDLFHNKNKLYTGLGSQLERNNDIISGKFSDTGRYKACELGYLSTRSGMYGVNSCKPTDKLIREHLDRQKNLVD